MCLTQVMSPGATAEEATSLELYQSPGSQKVTDAKLWLALSTIRFLIIIRTPARTPQGDPLLSQPPCGQESGHRGGEPEGSGPADGVR